MGITLDELPVLIPHLKNEIVAIKRLEESKTSCFVRVCFFLLHVVFGGFVFSKKKKVCLCVCACACMLAFWQNSIQRNAWKLKSNKLSVSQQQKFPTLLSHPPKRA